MPKCWIHNKTGEQKPSKPLKEHPGWGDNSNYQQNLAIILTPPKKVQLQEKLEKDIATWKLLYELERDNNQKIQQEITEKNNRIAQLNQLNKETAQTLTNQNNNLDKVKKQLEKELANEKAELEEEKKNKKLTAEQIQHYQEDIQHLADDIKRLDQEKKDLADNIQELNTSRTKSEQVRDQEILGLKKEKDELIKQQSNLQIDYNKLLSDTSNILIPQATTKSVATDYNKLITQAKEVIQQSNNTKNNLQGQINTLTTQKTNLTKQLADIQAIDTQANNTLGQQSSKNGLLLRSQEVIQKYNNLSNQLNTANSSLKVVQQSNSQLNSQLATTRNELDFLINSDTVRYSHVSIVENYQPSFFDVSKTSLTPYIFLNLKTKGRFFSLQHFIASSLKNIKENPSLMNEKK